MLCGDFLLGVDDFGDDYVNQQVVNYQAAKLIYGLQTNGINL